MKQCIDCRCEKPSNEFYVMRSNKVDGLQPRCKSCAKANAKRWFADNSERAKLRKALYAAAHPGRLAEAAKKYRAQNAEKIRKQKSEWRKANPDKVARAKRRYHVSQYRNNPNYQAAIRLRRRFKHFLSGSAKPGAVFNLVGYTREQLVARIESTFQPGMSWGKPETFHIDHVRPLSSFDLTKPEEVIAAFALSNLQALSPEANLKKSDTYDPDRPTRI